MAIGGIRDGDGHQLASRIREASLRAAGEKLGIPVREARDHFEAQAAATTWRW